VAVLHTKKDAGRLGNRILRVPTAGSAGARESDDANRSDGRALTRCREAPADQSRRLPQPFVQWVQLAKMRLTTNR
jgi:hypothetical protein